MAQPNLSKRLIVFCDGTWVGRETKVAGAPPSNIRMMADMVGEVEFSRDPRKTQARIHKIRTSRNDVVAGYQEGVGLGKTFLEYLWDGATASTIGEECVSVYKFIVENYTLEHDIWLFGFSRGAYTLRCVAGMINNCGIIKRHADLDGEELDTLCKQVYRTYRSTLPVDHPKSERCVRMKGDQAHVWPVKRPIRFMGLLDTVGALGIPRLNAGIGFDWPEFFDQKISSVVQEVYHAPCLHDRLWIFQPCLAFEGDGKTKARVHQMWLPGCHYDVGRQTFRFIRQSPANWIEGLLGLLPDSLSRTIFANQVLADVALRWMLKAVLATEGECPGNTTSLVPSDKIAQLEQRMVSVDSESVGSGDAYGNVLYYAPGGVIWTTLKRLGSAATRLLNALLPQLGDNIQDLVGIKAIVGILTATNDRRIPGYGDEDVYNYKATETAKLNRERYPSQTYESFELWKRVFGGD
ncbi:hypothetical protein BS50DRAFT_596263 [Corynespora cassiicola Philippines]|uniref:T6SS Phospholipase effector Tle1-like catalytic domain-containing protein n=1 Tax=Corynespora cassiicola Philippines TaxID=1448308 RepID=A0A2T2PC18_CORCC|nr:hypothetical protein BS50DRAFT_596263 [Corynespora cassiicola Philippines]